MAKTNQLSGRYSSRRGLGDDSTQPGAARPLAFSVQPMLAKKYKGEDPTGWWMSEKFNGIRSIWTGSVFVSKNGNVFNAPDCFKKGLLDLPLDGELWCGRNKLEAAISKVQMTINPDWRGMKYVIFDRISTGGFAMRMEILDSLRLPPHVGIVEQIRCRGRSHLEEFMASTIKFDGEGVVIREPDSGYIHGKTDTVLKLKPVYEDEATVVAYKAGNGRLSGLVGALVCNYKEFVIKIGGLSDYYRRNPPPIGSIVTFSYPGKTRRGIPNPASFVAVRDYE